MKTECIMSGVVDPDLLFLNDGPSSSAEAFGTAYSPQEWKLLRMMIPNTITSAGLGIVRIRSTEDDKKFWEPSKLEILNNRASFLFMLRSIAPKRIVFAGTLCEKYYRKEFKDALKIQSVTMMMDFGMEKSSWFKTNVRLLADYIKKGL